MKTYQSWSIIVQDAGLVNYDDADQYKGHQLIYLFTSDYYDNLCGRHVNKDNMYWNTRENDE